MSLGYMVSREGRSVPRSLISSSIAGRSFIIFAKNLFQRMLVEFGSLLGPVVANERDLNFVDQGTGP